MLKIQPEDVLAFWLDDVDPDDWYAYDPKLDGAVRGRFEAGLERGG